MPVSPLSDSSATVTHPGRFSLPTGKTASKRQAALWAQEEFPEWSRLVQSALTWRQAWRDEHVDHAATRAETMQFVKFVTDQTLA